MDEREILEKEYARLLEEEMLKKRFAQAAMQDSQDYAGEVDDSELMQQETDLQETDLHETDLQEEIPQVAASPDEEIYQSFQDNLHIPGRRETDGKVQTFYDGSILLDAPTMDGFGWYAREESLRTKLAAFLQNLYEAKPDAGFLIIGPEKSGKTILGCRMANAAQNVLRSKGSYIMPITAAELDRRDIPGMLTTYGIAYIEAASGMSDLSVEILEHFLDLPGQRPILFLEDTQEGIAALEARAPKLMQYFTSRITLPTWNDDQLASFGHALADEMGYEIETMADLALHSRIADLQTYYHSVNLEEVKDMILDAILNSKKNLMKKLIVRRSTLEAKPQLLERDFKTR